MWMIQSTCISYDTQAEQRVHVYAEQKGASLVTERSHSTKTQNIHFFLQCLHTEMQTYDLNTYRNSCLRDLSLYNCKPVTLPDNLE